MGLLVDIYERLLKKLQRQKSTTARPPLRRTQSLKETQSMRETREGRSSSMARSHSIARPRSHTELIIERKRISRGNSAEKEVLTSPAKTTEIEIRKKSTIVRADSLPTPIVVSRSVHSTGPAHLNIVSSGSILAPTYKSRKALVRQHTVVVTL